MKEDEVDHLIDAQWPGGARQAVTKVSRAGEPRLGPLHAALHTSLALSLLMPLGEPLAPAAGTRT